MVGQVQRGARRATPLSVLALVAVLLGGSALQWFALDRRPLEESELIHLSVAQSLNAGQGPLLPSGNSYMRGLETTRMIAAGLRVFDTAAFAVRAPAAFAGTLSLLLFAFVVWRIAGVWAAVAATFLLATYPEALRLARMGRFYSLQLVFGLAALYAGWRVFEAALHRQTRDDPLRGWPWALLAIVSLTVAARIQIVTLSVAAGLAVAWTIAALLDLRRRGRAALRTSVTLQLVGIGCVLVPALLVLRSDLAVMMVDQARSAPFWARNTTVPGPLHYVVALGDSAPVVMSFAPLAFAVLLLRRPWLGLYLLTWFTVPLLIHSLLLPFRQERFILLAMPAVFMAVGVAAAFVGATLYRDLNGALVRRIRGRERRRWITAALVALVTLSAAGPLAAKAAGAVVGEVRRSSRQPDWSRAREIIAQDAVLQSLPLGGGHPLPALHYLGRVSFSVRVAFLERAAGQGAVLRTGSAFQWAQDGVPEYYAGIPVLTTPEAVREWFEQAPGVLIVLEERELTGGQTTGALRQQLLSDAHELCAGRCGSLRMYHWRWQ